MTYFDVEQKAGTTRPYTVVLVNGGTADQGVFKGRTFAADARTKVNGGLTVGSPDDPKTGVTTWLNYPNDVVTLAPGKGIERTFDVSVPKDAAPGQYITALSFETAEPIAIAGTPNFKQNLRQTVAFLLTIPGKVHPEFTIDNVRVVTDPAWTGVQADIVNSGNILVRPEGRLIIGKSDGTPLVTTALTFGSFYAGQTGQIETGLGNSLPSGDYLVTIDLHDAATGASAVIESQKVATTTTEALAEASTPAIAFSDASAEIKPDASHPQFLNIAATIENTGDDVTDAQLAVEAKRDGTLVENYLLVSPLSLPPGDTPISTRYIPATGWEPGDWTFSLSIQVLDRESGVARVVSTIRLGDPIVIP